MGMDGFVWCRMLDLGLWRIAAGTRLGLPFVRLGVPKYHKYTGWMIHMGYVLLGCVYIYIFYVGYILLRFLLLSNILCSITNILAD